MSLQPGDALIVVDLQNDFLPGGALAVSHGDEVIPALNHYIAAFTKAGLPIFATRDWHPQNHCSFSAHGGTWPSHCIAGTQGAAISSKLQLPGSATIVSKATTSETDAYSGFAGTDLAEQLRRQNVSRVFVGGLATDYCVLNTVRDALQNQFQTFLLSDASRAVNVKPGDGARAEQEMIQLGALPISLQNLGL